MTSAKILGITALVCVVIAGFAWFEYNLWSECRQTNSVLYCMRLLGG